MVTENIVEQNGLHLDNRGDGISLIGMVGDDDDDDNDDDDAKENHVNQVKQHQLPTLVYNPQVWDFAFHGKLYCRNKERSDIITSYKRMKDGLSSSNGVGKTEIILIHGPTGVGKTTLASSIRLDVMKDGGYYISGKFDQLQSPEPYSALIAGLTEFSKLVISRGNAEIARVRKDVERYIKTEKRVLTDMIPSLKDILVDNKKDVTTSTHMKQPNFNIGMDATSSFKYIFSKFIQAISSKENPLVFLLDDLHWADEASLDLLSNILLDSSINEGIIYLGTYRDENKMSIERLQTTINDDQINARVIGLNNFTVDDVNLMLSEILKYDQELTRSLTSLIYSQTNGNILFTLEFLHSLYTQNILLFDSQDKRWRWSIDSINHQSSSLCDFITTRIQCLPESAQNVLKYASCLGTKFDEVILQHLLAEPVSPILHSIVDCRLIRFDEMHGLWVFSHDMIQEATYGIIPSEDRRLLHYRLGRKLWRVLTLDELDHSIFVVVGQLLFGKDLMHKQEERTAVAKLCFRAGERAVHLSSFRTAFEYLSQAIALLGPNSWRSDYDFCLSLYNAAAEVAYCNGDVESVYKLVEVTFNRARLFEHTIQAHCTKLYSLGSSGRLEDAIDLGLSVLKSLDEDYPLHPSKLRILMLVLKVKRKLRGKTDQDLLNIPLMDNPKKLYAIQIVNAIFLYVSMVNAELAGYIALHMILLSSEHGHSVLAPTAYVSYAMYLFRYENNIAEGFRFGRLGLLLHSKISSNHWTGRFFAAYYGNIHPMKMPIKECREAMKYAQLVAWEKGDLEYAFVNGSLSLWFLLLTSDLPHVNKDLQALRKQIIMFGQEHTLTMLEPFSLTVQILLGSAQEACEDTLKHDSEYDRIHSVNKVVMGWSHFHRMWLYYLCGHYDEARVHSMEFMSKFSKHPANISVEPFVLLFFCLIKLEYARKYRHNTTMVVRSVKTYINKLKKFAIHAPSNSLGKQFLIQAELAAFRKQDLVAFAKFTCAISQSKDSGFIMEAALSNERAAKFLLRIGEKERSLHFFREALFYYRQWGSKRKEGHLMMEIKNTFSGLDAI